MADVIVQLASVRHYLLSFETVDDCNQAGKHLQVNNAVNMQIYKNKEITTMQRKQVFLAITFAERITPAKVKTLFPPPNFVYFSEGGQQIKRQRKFIGRRGGLLPSGQYVRFRGVSFWEAAIKSSRC